MPIGPSQIAAPLPASEQALLPVIATTKAPDKPASVPKPAPIVRVSATDLTAPPARTESANDRVPPGPHYRLPFPIDRLDRLKVREQKVISVGIETELDLLADETPALAWEHWLGRHVIQARTLQHQRRSFRGAG